LILILASEFDSSARKLVEEWQDKSAILLTVNHLCNKGWRAYLGNDHCYSEISIANRKICEGEIKGVMTRLPYVFEDELYNIVNKDRSYISSEITAFLFYWLTSLKCKVINTPTPLCLIGPNWTYEQWIIAASSIGIPVISSSQGQLSNKPVDLHTITVVGEKTFGESPEVCHRYAVKLAEYTKLRLFDAKFIFREESYHFCGVNLLPDIKQKEVINLLYEYFNY